MGTKRRRQGVEVTSYVHATALASKGTRLTVHILAAVAEHEREMISERTKA
ncbi:MAG: recombinase family protein, partial [Xanthobacteraceae bacterium]